MTRRILLAMAVLILVAIISLAARSILSSRELQAATERTDPREQLLVDMISFADEVTGIVREAKDIPTAKAAVPKLHHAATEAHELRNRIQALGSPEAAVQKALDEKYAQRLKMANAQSAAEDQRIRSDPELDGILGRSLDGLAAAAAPPSLKQPTR